MSAADIDHAGLMDKVYRQQRHIYDLTRRYYLLGRDTMIAGLDAAPGCPFPRSRLRHRPQSRRRCPRVPAG